MLNKLTSDLNLTIPDRPYLHLVDDIYSTDNSFMMHLSVDSDGFIKSINGKALEHAGITSVNFIGKNIFNISFSENKLLFHLQKLIKKEECSAVIETENAFYDTFLFKDSNNGSFTNCIVKEITDSVSLKNEIKDQVKYFFGLFESSPDGIIILDSDYNIINFNKSFEKLFGYNDEELRSSDLAKLIVPDDLNSEAEHLLSKAVSGEMVKSETVRKCKDGSLINVYIVHYPILMRNGKICVYGIYSDISKRKIYEQQLKSSLAEKEVLLKEIHHRVKNNLQIIASLLNFQSRFVKDKNALELFKESQNRVKSIALIHEKLYQTKDISRLNFANYVRSLVSYLFISFGIRTDKVNFVMNADNIFLSIDNAIPCGLIINELVTNALKYAFNDDRKGEILIKLEYLYNSYVLTVKDNGSGIPDNIDISNTETFGLQLVKTLVSQLEADMTLDCSNGTEYTIKFSNLNYKGRI